MRDLNYSRLLGIILCAAFISFLISCAGSGVKKEAEAEFESGLSLFHRSQYEEAIPYFERATKLLPEYWRAHLYLGRSYLNLGEWQKALPPLRTAFQIAPEEANKEVAQIIVDVFFKNSSKLDQATQAQFMDLLNLK
jgi:tetratricopeptide (TPR) repeat protein